MPLIFSLVSCTTGTPSICRLATEGETKAKLVSILLATCPSIAIPSEDKALPRQLFISNLQIWDAVSSKLTDKTGLLAKGNHVRGTHATESETNEKAVKINGKGHMIKVGMTDAHTQLRMEKSI